ncbi:hypothetical protein ACEWY4_018665 [Coilia grayii]|uniref:Ig-like domain-containing protein n=1 Tax=Coilia grayii TaxID=363190 RepID=A0ABD1JFF2_9TELE
MSLPKIEPQLAGSNVLIPCNFTLPEGFEINESEFISAMWVKVSPEVVEASVSPSGAVTEGSSVTLTCNSSEANPPVHDYTWFRDTQTSPVGSGPNYTFSVSSSHAGLYYCRAEHPQGGKESNRVELKVTDSFHPIFMIALGGCLGGFLLCAGTGIALGIKRWKVLQQNEQCSIPQDSSVHGKDGPAHTSAPNPTKDHLEEIQYGQISFSRPPLGDRGEGTGQQGLGLAQAPESVYAKVTLSGREGQARYQKAPNTQDLYAQVKRK